MGFTNKKISLTHIFPGPFFINFLVCIFKMAIDFMLRNFIMHFLILNIFLTFSRMIFLVLCIVTTIFTNATNLCNIFLIFYNHLNFCYFTIFDSVRVAVVNFITTSW